MTDLLQIPLQDNASLAAQCRRHLGLRDCEQLLLSVGKGPWDEEVRQKACKKIADLLQSRTLLDTPLDKVIATKTPDPTEEPADASETEEPATLATVSPDALPTLAPVKLATVAPVELATVAPLPEVELVTLAPVELPTLAPLPVVSLPTVAPAADASAEGKEAEGEQASQAQATPGLLNALGQTFVSPAAELTPEERKGQEDEESRQPSFVSDRPSWLSRSADLSNALDAVDTAIQPILTTPVPLKPVTEALRGAANGLLKGLAESEQTQKGEADASKQSDQEHPSWKKEQSFHERETDEAKGPFGVDLGDFISSHANQDPTQKASDPEVEETEGRSDEDWQLASHPRHEITFAKRMMEDKFDLRRKVVDSSTHKMLLWAFLFVASVSFASSLVIRWRPTAPTAYSRLEAQVPFSSSRQALRVIGKTDNELWCGPVQFCYCARCDQIFVTEEAREMIMMRLRKARESEKENELERAQMKENVLTESLSNIEQKERALHSRTSELKKSEDEIDKKSLELQKKRDILTQSMADIEEREQVMQQKKAEQEETLRQIQKRVEVVQKKTVEMQQNEEELQRKTFEMQGKQNLLTESLREMEETEHVLHCKTSELLKNQEEFEEKSHEVQRMKEELEKNIRELQEVRNKKLELLEKELLERNALGKRSVDETEFQNLKAVVDGLQQEVARITCSDASSGYSDTTSVHTLDSWIQVGSPKPCCFHPDAHFKVFTSDGPVLAPASMLHQGARVQSASGKVVEVVSPPEQHQVDSVIELKAGTASLVVSPDHRVDSVIELKAGTASLVVSPDHRVLVPGHKTAKAEELSEGDEVILDGFPARLSSCEWKTGKTLVIRLGFKPDLPVAALMRPSSILSKGFRKKQLRRSLKKKVSQPVDGIFSQAADDTYAYAATEGCLTDYRLD
eukprot:s571_g19.t1